MLTISIGHTLTAVCIATGPLTPTETPSPFLSVLNANTCPKLRTSIHSSQAAFAY